LVIIDMNRQTVYTKQKDEARMYDGRQVIGIPVITIVRGAVIMRDGDIIGEPGYGRFISPLGGG